MVTGPRGRQPLRETTGEQVRNLLNDDTKTDNSAAVSGDDVGSILVVIEESDLVYEAYFSY